MLATARAQGSAASRKLTKHHARETLKRVAACKPLREIPLSYNVDRLRIHRLRARYTAEA
jgi:hypothetical protein